MPRDPNSVLICTPVRDGRFHTGYVVGMMQSNGLHNGWLPYSGQSDIYIARNVLANAFLAQKQYETMVCIDSDIAFTRGDLQNLIESDGDVVSGIYPDKTQPPQPFCRDENGNNVAHKDIPPQGMIRSKFIPGGFFKVERRAIDTIIAGAHVDLYGNSEELVYAFYCTRYARNDKGSRYMVSEDFSFSVLLEEAGIQAWTNCGIRVGHDGRTWDGQILDNQT